VRYHLEPIVTTQLASGRPCLIHLDSAPSIEASLTVVALCPGDAGWLTPSPGLMTRAPTVLSVHGYGFATQHLALARPCSPIPTSLSIPVWRPTPTPSPEHWLSWPTEESKALRPQVCYWPTRSRELAQHPQ
jgi:hypothetical protein